MTSMTPLKVLAGLLILAGLGSGPAEFDKPWTNKDTALAIDPYGPNDIDWDKLATDSRVVAIIHQATSGNKKDAKYAERKALALSKGYKWGAYHLGLPGDPIQQADFYLSVTQPGSDEVIALDIETLDPKKSMTLENARLFIAHIKEKTGRYPLFYGNQSIIQQVSSSYGKRGEFSLAPLWYARYKSTVHDFPKGTWPTYTLWQFKSELNCTQNALDKCPYVVPGTEPDMDVSVYNGTIDDLKKRWPFATP
jgi:GH25 family lysozyme M1 (1,4-beta-N-acetylmuramidase)